MHLDPEQEEVLSVLVEAARNVPREKREPFLALSFDEQRNLTVRHPGLPDSSYLVYPGDFEVLARASLVSIKHLNNAVFYFDILPSGFAYYLDIKNRHKDVLDSAETEIRNYLDSDRLQKKYPNAHQKVKTAADLLWHVDSENQLTTIGHLCREALQEFATALVESHGLTDVDRDKAHTVSRIRSVINSFKKDTSEAEIELLDALVAYWGTVNDLVQRQEHGGQKEGRALIWNDARRVVFQTAIVMYEIESSLVRQM